MAAKATSKLTCYGLHWARCTLTVETDQIKAKQPQWLLWFAEKEIQRQRGVKMRLKEVKVEN